MILALMNRIYGLPVAHHKALTYTLGYHHRGNPEEQCCVCFSVSWVPGTVPDLLPWHSSY